MQRLRSTPRADWQKTVESQGFYFHTTEEPQPYWDESVYYRFTRAEIDALEQATYALDDMCIKAVQHVIDDNLLEMFQVPPTFADWLRASWNRDEITIYGRFDLAYDGIGPPKLLEYNADTPTSLLESAVIQWFWMKDLFPQLDQFNSIHERLIEAWKRAGSQMPGPWLFTCVSGSLEDYMTASYLRDTAMQAGLSTQYLPIEKIGWNWDRNVFVDQSEQPIVNCFKLYPWEWMLGEQFGPQLLRSTVRWMEAPWKMILSHKAILPVLWQLFPQSPYLLNAAFEPLAGSYVRKPVLGREGANIVRVVNGHAEPETAGPYGGPYVFQELHPLRSFDGNFAVVGSWMVNGYACGIGIREDASPVTQNTSRFVPHVIG
ncbi:MAG TPA: glutathionylspermidine synthase family protein [Tepidisphaeraceae bacterium]|nr:glutathionylspermidine synthase family protein [Tepidisphaeraceae bacterium]